MSDEDLLSEIIHAEATNMHARPCQACQLIVNLGDSPLRDAVERALSGTVGETRLAAILKRNGYSTGARAIKRHRQEGH